MKELTQEEYLALSEDEQNEYLDEHNVMVTEDEKGPLIHLSSKFASMLDEMRKDDETLQDVLNRCIHDWVAEKEAEQNGSTTEQET